MKKKKVALDVASDTLQQTLTLVFATKPELAVAAVATVSSIAGISRQLFDKRHAEIEGFAKDLCDPRTAQSIREMENEKFFDDLAYSLEKILSQRTQPKRILMRNVFIGYINTEHKQSYPLEKMYKAVENLTFADVATLKRIFEALDLKAQFPIPYVTSQIMNNHNVPSDAQSKLLVLTSSNDAQEEQSKANLVTEGLVKEYRVGLGTWDGGDGEAQYGVTVFGEHFKQYLLELESLD